MVVNEQTLMSLSTLDILIIFTTHPFPLLNCVDYYLTLPIANVCPFRAGLCQPCERANLRIHVP